MQPNLSFIRKTRQFCLLVDKLIRENFQSTCILWGYEDQAHKHIYKEKYVTLTSSKINKRFKPAITQAVSKSPKQKND